MKLFNDHEKNILNSAFLECAKELPSDKTLQSISFTDGFEQRMSKAFKRQKTAVLRRVVALCACLAMIVGVTGYFANPYNIPDVSAPQTENESNPDVETDAVVIPPTIDNIGLWAKELFIAKIISRPKKTKGIFDHYSEDADYLDDMTPTLCTAEVIDTLHNEIVDKNTKIKLYNNVYQFEKSYSKSFEKDKTYLIGGEAYRHGNSVSIECWIVAELDGDTLLPANTMTKNIFKGIDTLTQFKQNKDIQEWLARNPSLWEFGFIETVIKGKDRFYTKEHDYDYYLEHVKKAVQVGGPDNFYKIEQSEFGESLIYDSTEIFTAKIIKEAGKVEGEFENKDGKIPIIYHVEVQNTYFAQFVDKSTTIRYIYFADNENDRLDVSKEYLLSGISEPFEDKVAVIGSDKVFARIENGKLYDRCDALKKINTLKKLDMCDLIIEMRTFFPYIHISDGVSEKYFLELNKKWDYSIPSEIYNAQIEKVKGLLLVKEG